MKIRYILLTVLTFALLLYGVAVLFLHVLDKTNLPPLAQSAPIQVQTDTVVGTQNTNILLPIEDTVDTSTEETQPLPDKESEAFVFNKKERIANLYDKQRINEIATKYASVNPTKWGEEVPGIVYKINVSKGSNRIIFLTFNAYTKDYPTLFDFLERHKIKSTFFLTGIWVRNNPEQAKKIGALSSLFEIENHGNKNIALSATGYTTYGRKGTENLNEAINEVIAGAEAIEKATGQTPQYVRSFLNCTDNIVIAALAAASIQTIGFSDTGDGGGLFSSETIKNQILKATTGSIILLNVNPDYPNILEGLQAAVEEIEKEKLSIRFEKLVDYEQYFEYLP